MNRLILVLVLGLAIFCCSLLGCSGIRRMDTAKDAIDHGSISGLSASNHWSATVWSTPAGAGQPYSKIRSLPITVGVSPTNSDFFVFYMGKSVSNKKWEVFSASKWQDGRWEQVAVKLPASEIDK
jgi:hypothetical protein